jgi:pilus assembly protein Flp/PilA
MSRLVKKVVQDRKGATAIEYGLIAALVAVAIVGGLQLLGPALNTAFSTVATDVKTATG